MIIESVIFDLDGTLWDSVDGVVKSFNKVLATYPETKTRLTPEFLRSVMGLPMREIAVKLFPDLDESRRIYIFEACCREECAYLAEHGGILYPKVPETLEILNQQYQLAIVSNCQPGYIEAFFEAHQLGKYFIDTENAGRTGLSKGENIKLLMKRNQIKTAVYVGDTAGDLAASRLAGVPFVFARYGFGDAAEHDLMIDNFSQLTELLSSKELIF